MWHVRVYILWEIKYAKTKQNSNNNNNNSNNDKNEIKN